MGFASLQQCVILGFSFHFVKDQILIMSHWLPDDVPSRLPLGPTHQVGVGALVLHPSDPTQMLVVQEKTGPGTSNKLADPSDTRVKMCSDENLSWMFGNDVVSPCIYGS